jgi:hypothetical protein
MKKRGVPLMYQICRDKILKHSNWRCKIHYKNAKAILGYFGVPRDYRDAVLQEMFDYKLLDQEPLWVIVVGAKKKCIFG